MLNNYVFDPMKVQTDRLWLFLMAQTKNLYRNFKGLCAFFKLFSTKSFEISTYLQ